MNDIVLHNLLSPAILFFILGLAASFAKSDLKFPSALSESLSIYLMIAIGLKGGMELSQYSIRHVIFPLMGTLLLGIIIPFITFTVCSWLKLDRKNAIALAATYGSVSIVTFGAAVSFLQQSGTPYEGFMNAMVVLLESPAILVSILMLRWMDINEKKSRGVHSLMAIKETFFGKSILLLTGSLCIGLLTGKTALQTVKPLFVDLYSSILIVFLLGMGLAAGERIGEIRDHGIKLAVLAVAMPLFYGTIGGFIGTWSGLSVGGTFLMSVLAASSSYIAAPAALKHTVPEANPSIYLGMSLGITFPFNIIIGIPLYFNLAQWLHS
ncbi:MAG: sodium-dependent bicarbonate transport family permease [Candidatus Reconcilbacillus cellulovorans]|uniref:Sodium-dependent bicarbonate transport family permease n=1 Tax=Candidatus Reconcilbacillus cellulovorans TaxID=1906605 RepID=A0A2A6E278_9BACL|nr:MAG: sodium-dependent bicarbonate transport family permease [Candidatus Reconcilbacillus cellulovorans]